MRTEKIKHVVTIGKMCGERNRGKQREIFDMAWEEVIDSFCSKFQVAEKHVRLRQSSRYLSMMMAAMVVGMIRYHVHFDYPLSSVLRQLALSGV